ncbi:hypothetical protein SAMN05518866_13769, partial [Sphingobium sp. YR768]
LAGDCEKDFWTNRQLWPLIVAEVALKGEHHE